MLRPLLRKYYSFNYSKNKFYIKKLRKHLRIIKTPLKINYPLLKKKFKYLRFMELRKLWHNYYTSIFLKKNNINDILKQPRHIKLKLLKNNIKNKNIWLKIKKSLDSNTLKSLSPSIYLFLKFLLLYRISLINKDNTNKFVLVAPFLSKELYKKKEYRLNYFRNKINENSYFFYLKFSSIPIRYRLYLRLHSRLRKLYLHKKRRKRYVSRLLNTYQLFNMYKQKEKLKYISAIHDYTTVPHGGIRYPVKRYDPRYW